MSLSKYDRYNDRFNPNNYGPKLRMVEPIWHELIDEFNSDRNDESYFAEHDQESESIKRQITCQRPDNSVEENANNNIDDNYRNAIEELNASLPPLDLLIRWAQDNAPPQTWCDEEGDLF